MSEILFSRWICGCIGCYDRITTEAWWRHNWTMVLVTPKYESTLPGAFDDWRENCAARVRGWMMSSGIHSVDAGRNSPSVRFVFVTFAKVKAHLWNPHP
jgi:hypothetical protein